MTMLLGLLRAENEENAVLCLKMVVDLHRTFRTPNLPPPAPGAPPPEVVLGPVEASAPEFLEIVAEMFKNMKGVVEETFAPTGHPSADAATPSPAAAATPTAEETVVASLGPSGASPTGGTLPLGMKSFKVLQDCPAAIVFMFQTYRSLIEKAIPVFVPLVFNVGSLLLQFRVHSS